MSQQTSILSSLEKPEIDHHSPVPLYHQVYLHLRQQIITLGLPAGQLMPSEKELGDFYSVGRQTIRRAIAKLVDEGLVERFPGKGSFIKKTKMHQDFFIERSFTKQMANYGVWVTSKVLDQFTGIVNEDSSGLLQKKLGSKYMQLNRIRFGEQTPLGLQKSTVLLDRCPNLKRYDFEKDSLYRILQEEFHLDIGAVQWEISGGIASEEQTKLLNIPSSSLIIIENSTTFLSDGDIIEVTRSFYPIDQFRYKMEYEY